MVWREINAGRDDAKTGNQDRHSPELQALVMGRITRGQLPAQVRAQEATHSIDHSEPGTQFPGLQPVTADKERRLPLPDSIVKEIQHRIAEQEVAESNIGPEGQA